MMLARIGEGPLTRSNNKAKDELYLYGGEIDCEQGSCAVERSDLNGSVRSDEAVKNLCWGYEKRCKKENRLFVPRCEGPHRPWYAPVID